VDSNDLIILLGVIAMPAGFLAAVALVGWGYRRSLARSMTRSAAIPSFATTPALSPPSLSARECLSVRQIYPDDVAPAPESVENEVADARDTTRKVRNAYLSAALVYATVTNSALVAAVQATGLPFDVAITIAYLVLASEIVIVIWSFRHESRLRFAILGAYVLTGVVLALVLVARSRIMLLPVLSTTFALHPVAGLLLLLARRLQPLLIALVAVSLFVAIGAGIVGLFFPDASIADARPWVVAAGIANQALGVIIFGWLLRRRSVAGPIAALAAIAGVGIVAEKLLGPGHLLAAALYGLPLNVLWVFVVWSIFKLFVWLQDSKMLPGEVLHSHLCWGWLTAYLMLLAVYGTAFFGNAGWLTWALIGAFLCHLVVLHTLLVRIRADRGRKSAKRLLLLRVFGSSDKRERLLDVLEDSWRRLGRIDLITGTDLAWRSLGSTMLEAFLLRRVDDQFLKTSDEVDLRLKRLRSEVEGDLRFPVNSMNCYIGAWQTAVMRLASNADAVLVDLRGFNRKNEGCTFEINYLVHRVSLRRCVFLVDRTTDMHSLKDVAQSAWATLPPDSPNARDAKPELLVLNFETRSREATDALFPVLLRAALVPSRRDCQARTESRIEGRV
jgi:hypothetical protein